MNRTTDVSDDAVPFSTVLEAERIYIEEWRKETGRTGRTGLTGLALSGGGIRSAVFCLGVIQALAKNGVLKNFDYLSTVSGGGYIGSSLTWFTNTVAQFGVEARDLPYGIDDPTQPAPKQPGGKPLLAHLRRHGSYLDPSGNLSLLSGIAVVLRGLALNLVIIWLPIIIAILLVIRLLYRWLAHVTAAQDGTIWLQPLMFSAVFAVLFIVISIIYSLYSGWEAARHEDMPYSARRNFERFAPWLLIALGAFLVLGTLPYVKAKLASWISGVTSGAIMTILGAALGLWSRLVPKGSTAEKIPAWIGPLAAAFLVYGLGLLAYALSDQFLSVGQTAPNATQATVLVIVVVVAVFVGYFVDLNETTLHRFYRDRLMEAFMPDVDGQGRPHGKDASKANTEYLCNMCRAAKGPYHLINAHLVLTKTDKKGVSRGMAGRWRIRGGDSFVFAPRFSGGNAAGWHDSAANKALSKISLATAMAVSGAAVNPDAASSGVGPQRNRLFATLMALLNIRLGYWLPNPNRFSGRAHASAPNHFNPGLVGVIDRLSPTGKFLEITDGGNFENLGVYELLRRKVRTILVCDATADPESAFADFQNLLSRAEADFGVTVTVTPPPLASLMPKPARGRFPLGVPFATEPFVVGEIRYDDGCCGELYYIKPAIFAGLRLHVLGFKGAFPAFPDDTTLDQFFDEARFEAYRELGFACVDRMLADVNIKNRLSAM